MLYVLSSKLMLLSSAFCDFVAVTPWPLRLRICGLRLFWRELQLWPPPIMEWAVPVASDYFEVSCIYVSKMAHFITKFLSCENKFLSNMKQNYEFSLYRCRTTPFYDNILVAFDYFGVSRTAAPLCGDTLNVQDWKLWSVMTLWT